MPCRPPQPTPLPPTAAATLGGSNETCVSLAAIPGAEASFVIRDSKPEGAGKELRFTEAELDDFATGWVRTRGLTL